MKKERISFLRTMFYKNPANKKVFKSKQNIKSIYGEETIGEQTKRFNFVHYVLKYKLFVPMILLVRKISGKRLVEEIPDKKHFEYAKMFNDIIDETTVDWGMFYLASLRHTPEMKTVEYWQKKYRDPKERGAMLLIRTLKEIVNTIVTNDDAYLEYLPMFFWNVVNKMNEHVKNNQQLMENGKFRTHHLLHTVPAIMSQDYENVYLSLRETKNFEVTPSGAKIVSSVKRTIKDDIKEQEEKIFSIQKQEQMLKKRKKEMKEALKKQKDELRILRTGKRIK